MSLSSYAYTSIFNSIHELDVTYNATHVMHETAKPSM